jgi:hypothetical protein
MNSDSSMRACEISDQRVASSRPSQCIFFSLFTFLRVKEKITGFLKTKEKISYRLESCIFSLLKLRSSLPNNNILTLKGQSHEKVGEIRVWGGSLDRN